MSEVRPRILKGFRDYLPETQLPKERMLREIAAVFEGFGYAPLQTPALEYAEVLLGKCGEEGDKLLYRFEDHGGRDVALRYDLTVPLARVVAQYGNLESPFRRYQIAPVWRGEKPGRGRYREFVQCDADITGTSSLLADVETLQVACAVLDRLGVRGYRLRVSHRKLLGALLESVGLDEGGRGGALIRAIDKLDKVGEAGVRESLRAGAGLGEGEVDRVFEFLAAGGGDPGIVLARVRDCFAGIESGEEGARDLEEVMALAGEAGIGDHLAIDPSLARGMDYYTGTIAEGVLTDLPGFGSVLGGGRYDRLVGLFRGDPVPAVGISIGVDRLLAGLGELDLVPGGANPADVLVAVFDRESAGHALRLAGVLRAGGLRAEVYPDDTARLGKQFRYADRKGIPYVAVQGPDERRQGRVAVKDMVGGGQEPVDADAVAAWIAGRIRGRDSRIGPA